MLCIAVPEQFSGPDGDSSNFGAADVVLGSLADLDETVWRRLEIRPGSTLRASDRHSPPETLPIVVVAGDEVSVGERSPEWPAFVRVTNSDGGRGWVPERILAGGDDHNDHAVQSEKGEDGDDRRTVREGYRYDTKELEVAAGTELRVIEPDPGSSWVWCADPEGHEGWVPVRVLEVV
jgi:hypothetical protein